jgi:hypothetical protein
MGKVRRSPFTVLARARLTLWLLMGVAAFVLVIASPMSQPR